MAKAKKPIDWKAVERDYTKTALPVRELARWYNCDEKAIRLRAKAGGWLRPGADAPQPTPHDPQPLADAVAPIVERVRLGAVLVDASPETIITRGQSLAVRMLDELEADTAYIGEIEQAIEDATPGKDAARRRDAMMKAVSLSSRAGTLKNLALAAKTFAEATAPEGKKKQRQAAADQATANGGKFAQRSGPRLVSSNP
ncbi:lactam utilization protein B [Methylorubrum rhodinum]|uniref:Lactam utilization protein B n=1 Tax=Methylorubrum rhodinum TaxID=29428 RepID=A0A840ZPN6_9HYPH|nr:hypothetical protein [Methylorubrum rhodinum]MBB5758841.1 lactam utilization protein B [Methylorubrum rhodinum]